MPILAREPDIYPDNLLNDDTRRNDDSEWYVIQTLSRREKDRF